MEASLGYVVRPFLKSERQKDRFWVPVSEREREEKEKEKEPAG